MPTKIGDKLTHAEWVSKAERLAIKGWSIRRIAKKLDLHHSTVAEALAKELERVRPTDEEIRTRRTIQREQIDRQLGAWIPRSIGGDKDAALVVQRFMERAAKLDGLDAPTSIHFDVSKMNDEQLRLIAGDAPTPERGGAEGTPATEDGSDEASEQGGEGTRTSS